MRGAFSLPVASTSASAGNNGMRALWQKLGAVTRPEFEAFLREHLLPVLECGSVLVLDNARIHHGGQIAQLVEEAGCSLLYLPPYSPTFRRSNWRGVGSKPPCALRRHATIASEKKPLTRQRKCFRPMLPKHGSENVESCHLNRKRYNSLYQGVWKLVLLHLSQYSIAASPLLSLDRLDAC